MPELRKMNLNYLLNKAYYDELSYTHFSDCNKTLIGSRFQNNKDIPYFSEPSQSFCLKTAYPGLLIGIGNTHEAGTDINGDKKQGAEIKLGFTLDPVTGLPVIPGSTVKGVLRGAFESRPEYIADIINTVDNANVVTVDNVKTLVKKIFGGGDTSGKVVFFDALPVKADKGNHLFGLDNITPHNKPFGHADYAYNGLKNPIPLTMLKVIPGVVFLFRFGFERWPGDQIVDSGRLLAAFKEIISDLGIGAKTNVGYGVMEAVGRPEHIFCLEPALPSGGVVSPQRQGGQARAPENTKDPKAPGICQYPGCQERTKSDKNGDFHPFCQPHYLQSQGKRGNTK